MPHAEIRESRKTEIVAVSILIFTIAFELKLQPNLNFLLALNDRR